MNRLLPEWARSDIEKKRLFGLAAGFGASELILSDEDVVKGFLSARESRRPAVPAGISC